MYIHVHICMQVKQTCVLMALLPVPIDTHTTPGPGVYKPEGVTVNKRSAPTYSLGIRHSEYMTPLILEVSD